MQDIPQHLPVTGVGTAIISPFWADFDATGKDPTNHDESTIWLHEYVSHNYTAADEQTRDIMLRVKGDIETYAGHVGFTPTTVIIITWVNMTYVPYVPGKEEVSTYPYVE